MKILDLRGKLPAATAQPSRLEGAITDYLAAKRAGDNGRRPCSPTTLGSYEFALRKILLPFAIARGISSWDALSQAEIGELRSDLFEHGGPRGPLSAASANTYCRHINYFLAWLGREGETSGRVRAHVIPEPSRGALALDKQEVEALIRAAGNDRDRLIVSTLVDTGIRVSELTTLRFDRLDRLHDGTLIRVLEKGGQGIREREVPLVMPGALRRLQKYIADTGGRTEAQPYVFIGKLRSPRTGDFEPLSPNGVQQMLRNLRARAGLEKELTPHILRHTFITRALSAGVDPIAIAKIVGHRDLRMIMRHYDRRTVLDAGRQLSEALARERRRYTG